MTLMDKEEICDDGIILNPTFEKLDEYEPIRFGSFDSPPLLYTYKGKYYFILEGPIHTEAEEVEEYIFKEMLNYELWRDKRYRFSQLPRWTQDIISGNCDPEFYIAHLHLKAEDTEEE